MDDAIEPKRRLTRKQVGEFLRDHGFPIGNGTLNRISSKPGTRSTMPEIDRRRTSWSRPSCSRCASVDSRH
jgi:hypothetical protein